MQLSALLTHLPNNSIANMFIADPEADIYNVGFLTPGTGPLHKDILYFGDTTLLAESELGDFYNLLLFGSGLEDADFCSSNANVVTMTDDTNPLTCYNALQNYFLESQEQTSIIRRMLQAHFSNKGLQYLIEEAATALGNPIVVVDNAYRYVAYHLGELEGCDSQLAQTIVGEISNESLMEEVIAYIHTEGIDQQIANSKGPLVRQNSMIGANTMTAAVMANGVCMAHVMMIEYSRPFAEVEQRCFEQLAEFVGQELQKSEVWSPTSGELGAFFLANLLNDRAPSEAVTLRRLKALNFHPKKYLQVLCIHTSGEGLGQLQAENIAGQLKPLLHHAIYTRFHRQLVILLSRDEITGLSDFATKLLGEVTSLNEVSCGISNVFERVTQTRPAYDQARRAVRYGERASGSLNDHNLYKYSDYAYIHALDLVDRRTNLLLLCHPSLNTLRAYDDQHGGELMDTLFCYLQVAGSTTRAAKMLMLHKNTLLYRLNRIKQILGSDLSSGEELFQLQFSFRILLYLGLFAPRMVVERDDLHM